MLRPIDPIFPRVPPQSFSLMVQCALVVAVLALWALTPPEYVLIIGGVGTAIVYPLIALWQFRRSSIKLDPITYYFAWNAVALGLAAVYIGFVLLNEHGLAFGWDTISPENTAFGYLTFQIGSLALHCGLLWMAPRGGMGTVLPRLRPRGLLNWLVIMWLMGLAYNLRPDWFNRLGNLSASMQYSGLAAVCLLAIVPPDRFDLSPRAASVLVWIGTLGVCAGYIALYSKAYVMFSFLPLIWRSLILRRVNKRLVAFGIVLAVFYFVVVAPGVYEARRKAFFTHKLDYQTIFSAMLSSPSEGGLISLSDQFDQFFLRMYEPLPAGYLVGEVERDGFQNGAMMEEASYVLIPRVFWPEKPDVSRGAWFTTYLRMSARESEATSSTGITAAGELYWNFGMAGVVGGMFLIGSLAGALWRLAGVDPRGHPLSMLLYVLVTLYMVNMPEAVTVAVFFLACLMLYGAAFFILAAYSASRARRGMSKVPSLQPIHPNAAANIAAGPRISRL